MIDNPNELSELEDRLAAEEFSRTVGQAIEHIFGVKIRPEIGSKEWFEAMMKTSAEFIGTPPRCRAKNGELLRFETEEELRAFLATGPHQGL